MTTRWPPGRLHVATSSITILRPHIASSRLIVAGCIRQYAQQRKPLPHGSRQAATSAPPPLPKPDPVRSALTIEAANAQHDAINPPRSTLPPPLSLPTRGSETIFVYWFNIGRAYATFYKNGVKAVWYNYKATRLLKARIATKDIAEAAQKGLITRSEFQLLKRNDRDIGKLPLFGVLVLILGEWLPLFVPLMPNAVPGTCRIPKQVTGMREKAEQRRRISFRQGITIPSDQQVSAMESGSRTTQAAWALAFDPDHRRTLLRSLRDDQLHHLSSTLTLHSRLWDRIQLPPPAFLLRRAINKHLAYVAQDDFLLLKSDGAASRLSPDELQTACEERGLDVLGRKDEVLVQSLRWWLRRQEEDAGSGRVVLAMLFRRLVMREWVRVNVRANQGVL